jgi:hypothetical protein
VIAVVIILATLTWFRHARFEYRTPQSPEDMIKAIHHVNVEPLNEAATAKDLK